MPYVIRRDGQRWVVKKRFGGKVVGHTETRQDAVKMIQAIYANSK